MNSEIEQRIVAMYFDNKDFEKNAQQTIGTLGQLKEGLNLEDSVKGFDELDKASKKLNLNQARSSVTNLKNAFSGLGSVVQKAFNIGTAPIRALDNFFDTFRGYVGKFVGFDLASKFVNSLESAMRELTIAPIQAGWSMYQANVDSTKTIMSGTMKSYKEEMSKVNADWTYDEGEHMEFVKKHLRDLSDYAAKTVFSLQDMTSNVGKFTNQNIDLETSVTAMKGIANMTAKAGQSAQQASMAMYNFSQALGVGKMTTLDWKSIENANIATTELKDLFILTASAAGKLHKEVKKIDGKEVEEFFITVDKNGKKLAKKNWLKVSAENFRETLQQGWLDKDTMLRVMQLYSNEGFDLDTLAAWGFDIHDEELMKQLKEIGEEAMKAATQVRTFSKMWDALTESVQSSWADSMEFIFGDMTEATEFWTTINDKIGSVMDNIGRNRNNMLREWRGQTWDEESQAWIRLEGSVDGREDLIQGIYSLIDSAKSLGGAFSAAWSDVFGNLTGKKLQEITKGFRDFIDRFKEWLGDMDDTSSRLSKIRSGLSGIFAVLKVVWEVIKTVFGVIKEALKPLIDPILNLFDKFGKFMKLDKIKNLGDMLKMLRDRFSDLWRRVSSLGFEGVFIKIGDIFSNIWTNMKSGVVNFLRENGLGGFADFLENVGTAIRSVWEDVSEWPIWSSIGTFFGDIWGWLKGKATSFVGWFTEKDADDKTGFKTFLDNVTTGIKTVWDNVISWDIWSSIGTFFGDVWEWLKGKATSFVGWFTEKDADDKTGFDTFLDNVTTGIKTVWDNVIGWDIWAGIGTFFGDIWGWLKSKATSFVGWFTDEDGEGEGKSGFKTFLDNVTGGIKTIWDNVTGWDIWASIGEFFGNTWEWIKGKASSFADWFKAEDGDDKSGFKTFLDNVTTGIKTVWDNVVGWDIWPSIGKFFGNTWEWIKEKASSFVGWFSEKDENNKTGFVKFLEKLAGDLSRIWGIISNWQGWGEIGKFFGDVWGWIADFFVGSAAAEDAVAEVAESSSAVVSEAKEAAVPTAESVGLIERIITAISTFVTTIIDKVQGKVIPESVIKFFNDIGDFISGVLTFVSDLLGKAGRILSGKSSLFSEDGLPFILGGVAALAMKLMDFFEAKNLSGTKVQSAASQFMSVGIGLLTISAAITILAGIDTDKLLIASGVIVVIGMVLARIVHNLQRTSTSIASAIKSFSGSATPVTGTERIINNVIDGLKKIGMIAVALALLPEVIRAFGEAKKLAPELSGDDLMKTFVGLAGFVVAASAVLGILEKITANRGLDPVVALKTGLAIAAFFGSIIAGFGAIGGAIGLLQSASDQVQGVAAGSSAKANQKALLDAGETIKSLMSIVRLFWEGISGAQTDGQKVDSAQSILIEMAKQLEVFTAEKTSGLLRVLNLIGTLSQIVNDVPDPNKLSSFATTLGPLADGIAKFSFIMSGFTDENMQQFAYWNPDNLEAQVKNVEAVFRAFSHIDGSLSAQTASQFLNGIKFLNENMSAEDFKAFGHIVTGIVDSFNQAISTDSDAMGTMADSLMTNLSKAIKIGLSGNGADVVGAFDATPIVDSIVVAIGYGETEIAAAVHNMVQAGLNNSATDKDGKTGYDFDDGFLSGLMSFINNPEELLGGESGNGINDWLYGKGGTANSPTKDSFVGGLGDFKQFMDTYELPDLSSKLSSLYTMTDPTTGEPIDIVKNLRETLTAIGEELSNAPEFEVKIIPTFDLSKLNADVLRNELKDYPVRFPMGQPGGNYTVPDTIRVDFTGLSTALDIGGLRTGLDAINTSVGINGAATVVAIKQMGAHIDRISAAISQIKVYVDMYGMIPMIDKALGDRAAKSTYTGVSSMLGNPYAFVPKQETK